jgi:hypothetical protein
LAQRGQSAAFFTKQVADRITSGSSEAHRVVIVLSPPVEFERGEDLKAISVIRPEACSVFYIRYRARMGVDPGLRDAGPGINGPGLRRSQLGAPMGRRTERGPGRYVQNDQLARTLKPLDPRLFDVETPEEFRKALAAVMRDIARAD